MTHIVMIDYGAGNIRSAFKAFEHLGADIELTSDPRRVLKGDKLVLPGVGAFGAGMAELRRRDLEDPIHEAVGRGIPLLGICVGMQYLFETSDEMGQHTGLGLIPGRVTRFEPSPDHKVPHMGWNQLHHDQTHPLLKGVDNGAYCYFVHSYYCIPTQPEDTVATADYGRDFCAIVGRGNIFGLQFHPEKSHTIGLRILQNFIES
ncbi:MAG: imidazole glycerol phosphate synthase subunit HisH [Chloroflexi bacterium]|nr:imidazole glycerol phosphate synthase subunit HisH [Chloroflexota bacterium]